MFLREILIAFTMTLMLFFLFLLQKDFDIFCMLLFRAFLCVFDNSYLSFLCIEKNIKKYFYQFFQNICTCLKNMPLVHELCNLYEYLMNHSKIRLNCFKYSIFAFKDFSKNFSRNIHMENPNYKNENIDRKYLKAHSQV